jgi:hypothetical protein
MSDILKQLEKNDSLGFYTVGDYKTHNKIDALIAATKANTRPSWNFNDEVFSKVQWNVEPLTDLRELYRIRATQIRNKYDYIILNLSGGADSTTTLYSFVNNGLFIDEVIVRHPGKGTNNLQTTDKVYQAENAFNEWTYAALPALNWLKQASPNTKITIHDYSEELIKPTYDIDWVYAGRDYLHPGIVSRYSYSLPSMMEAYEKNNKVCQLFGIDKPRICVKDNAYYLYFLDIQANTAVSQVKEFDNITTEYFFWSPELPELLVKQSHLIANWFSLPMNNVLKTILRWPNHDISQRTTYEMIVKSIIYPDYDFTTFQTAKPSSAFETEIDSWFFKNFKGTAAFSIWEEGLDFVKQNIRDDLFNFKYDKKDGFVGNISPFYKIKSE